jgi:hypothetical protein
MTWLTSYYIYVLIITAPGGLTSQLGVYSTPEACEAARETYTHEQNSNDLALRASCIERIRTEYQSR